MATAVHTLVLASMSQFFIPGQDNWGATPMQFIHRLRNFRMAAAANTATPGYIF